MNYLSVFSGIEAASVAWGGLGFKPVGFSEINPFSCAVLSYRFPGIKNYGDINNFKEWEIDTTVDIVVGGSPCQSFSTTGFRKGVQDVRGKLMFTYGNLVGYFKPLWFVWENVPGNKTTCFTRFNYSQYIEKDIAATLLGESSEAKFVNLVLCAKIGLLRHLTPKEDERLQGFPDNWTQVPFNGKPPEKCPDRLRYKAIGNSMAVPVMRWIGQRITYVEKLFNSVAKDSPLEGLDENNT